MIDVKTFSFSYGRKKIFDNLSLSFKAGHIYGLLGKNGTGKSTLLRAIMGTLFPREGAIDVMGFTPSKRHPLFLQNIFMVGEEFYLPDVTVNKFVQLNSPFYPHFNPADFNRYMEEFEIPAGNTLQSMSYGQKKKVLISFALACNTAVLLLDEPTNGLDIMSKGKFRKLIAGALSDQKCIIISTHQVKDLENLIDRITIIDEGRILFDQTIESVNRHIRFSISFNEEELREALYYEPSIQGSAMVGVNTEGEDTRTDLELLYKAVITNGHAVRAVFERQSTGIIQY